MTPAELLLLAERVEAASGPDRALNREVALAVGWHRYSPSEIGKSNPGWIAPEDFIGEYVSRDGRRSPRLDSMHGTDVWREPRDYLASLDAAMELVSEGVEGVGLSFKIERFYLGNGMVKCRASVWDGLGCVSSLDTASEAATPALALTAAALRARAQADPEGGR